MRLRVPRILKELLREVGVDKLPRLAAALAYFGVFALPALLQFVLAVVGTVYGFEATRDRILGEFSGLAGESGARIVADMLSHVDPAQKGSTGGRVVAVVALLLGATGFMLQMQDALDTMWGSKGNAKRKGFVAVVLKRLFSLAMLMTLALLLLASLAVTAALATLGQGAAGALGATGSEVLVGVLEVVVAVGALTLLFALVFKLVPDLRIEWKEVWLGAAVTAALVVAGKWALGFWFGRSDPGATFGAAGPLALILLWMYYFALIVLVGAEFTQVYARLYGPRRAERTRRLERKSGTSADVPPAKSPARR